MSGPCRRPGLQEGLPVAYEQDGEGIAWGTFRGTPGHTGDVMGRSGTLQGRSGALQDAWGRSGALQGALGTFWFFPGRSEAVLGLSRTLWGRSEAL